MEILFQKKAIKYQTGKALLVKIPRDKWLVWLPKSLVKQRNWYLSAFLPQSMVFSLIYKGQKKNCTAKQLVGMFEGCHGLPLQEKAVTYMPQKLKLKKVEINDSLKR